MLLRNLLLRRLTEGLKGIVVLSLVEKLNASLQRVGRVVPVCAGNHQYKSYGHRKSSDVQVISCHYFTPLEAPSHAGPD
jgi:hypothetical protein